MIPLKVEAAELYKTTGTDPHQLNDPNVAHLVIHHNKVLSSHLLPGLEVEVKELEDGISAVMVVKEGAVFEKQVHLCFGMLPENGIQRIILDIRVEKNAEISVLAHCTFPNAVDVKHIMDAVIHLEEGAKYTYLEKHIHGDKGGVKVYPRARVMLEKSARFKTEFELLQGRVGLIEIDYETTCREQSVMEMTARINGTADDRIIIRETGYLVGEGSRGVLTSRVALRGRTRAEVHNKLVAEAAYARGHVDCKEIIQDQGVAIAIPMVEVRHPKAQVTHEAAIGSVDSKQLETLMSRGLTEEEGTDLIIQGLLS